MDLYGQFRSPGREGHNRRPKAEDERIREHLAEQLIQQLLGRRDIHNMYCKDNPGRVKEQERQLQLKEILDHMLQQGRGRGRGLF